MPMRRDPALWFNLAGVVAAYQPVAAPGPLLARYNQAHGGSNAYQAGGAALPTWAGYMGWTFDGSAQYLATQYVPQNDQSITLAISVIRTGSENGSFGGIYNGDSNLLGFNHYGTDTYFPANGTYYWNLSRSLTTRTVLIIAGNRSYTNGADDGITIGAGAGAAFSADFGICIGAMGTSGSNTARKKGCQVQEVAVYDRVLSPAEVWQASRQMAYCHVNSDWSAWGRRRRYYYAPAAAGMMFSPVGSAVIASSVVRSVQ